jgi:hypothetical protein
VIDERKLWRRERDWYQLFEEIRGELQEQTALARQVHEATQAYVRPRVLSEGPISRAAEGGVRVGVDFETHEQADLWLRLMKVHGVFPEGVTYVAAEVARDREIHMLVKYPREALPDE